MGGESTVRLTGLQRHEAPFTQRADSADSHSESEPARASGSFHHPSDAPLNSPQAHAQLPADRGIGQALTHEFKYVSINVVGAGVRPRALGFVFLRVSTRIHVYPSLRKCAGNRVIFAPDRQGMGRGPVKVQDRRAACHAASQAGAVSV